MSGRSAWALPLRGRWLVPVGAALVAVAGACVLAASGACSGYCEISASSYDQSCATDMDCVGIAEGNACGSSFCANCVNAAINVSAQLPYETDLTNVARTSSCSCADAPVVSCDAGRCIAHPYVAPDASGDLDASGDAGD